MSARGSSSLGNKWDLVREQGEYSQGELIKEIHALVPFAAFAPVTFLSALTKRKLGNLMPLIMKVSANLNRRISTAKLNAIVRDAVLAHPPPMAAGRLLKIFLLRASRRASAALRLPLQRTGRFRLVVQAFS